MHRLPRAAERETRELATNLEVTMPSYSPHSNPCRRHLALFAMMLLSISGCAGEGPPIIGHIGDVCSAGDSYACDAAGDRLLECESEERDIKGFPTGPYSWAYSCFCEDGCRVVKGAGFVGPKQVDCTCRDAQAQQGASPSPTLADAAGRCI